MFSVNLYFSNSTKKRHKEPADFEMKELEVQIS